MDNINRVNRPQQSGPITPRPPEKRPEQRPESRPIKKASKVKKPLVFGVIILAVLLIAAGAWYALRHSSRGVGIDQNKYQAVVLSTDLLLFGRLVELNDDYYKLTQVYYTVQTSTGDQTKASTSADQKVNTTELRKLPTQVHGPEDEMIIPKSQVLYFENLKPDGKASQLIVDDLKNKK